MTDVKKAQIKKIRRKEKTLFLGKEKKHWKNECGSSNNRDYEGEKKSGKSIALEDGFWRRRALADPAPGVDLGIPTSCVFCKGARILPDLILKIWMGMALAASWGLASGAPLPAVRVAGTQIVNEEGNPIRLRGVNFGGWLVEEIWMIPVEGTPPPGSPLPKVVDHASLWETIRQRFGEKGVLQIRQAWRDHWITREDFIRVKALGLNCVRLPFLHDSLEAPDGLFPRIDQAVAWAREAGVYLILDLHGTPGRQSGQHHTGKAQEDQLFKDPVKVRQAEDVWQKVASRYQGTPEIAAFDLMNEPTGAPNDSTLYLVYDRLLRAVREVAPAKPVIVADGYKGIAGMPYPEVTGWQQVIFSQHHYNFGAKEVRDHWKPLENLITKIGYAQARRKVPFLIGEMNIEPHSSPEMMTRIVDALDEARISWTVWCYKVAMRGQGGMWGLYRGRGNLPVVDPFTDPLPEILEKIRKYKTENFEESAMPSALRQTRWSRTSRESSL